MVQVCLFDLASPAGMVSVSRCFTYVCMYGRFEGSLPDNFLRVRTPEDFLEAIAGDTLVVADFFVPWCLACRRFHPALIKLASKNPECTFVAVCTLRTTTSGLPTSVLPIHT